MAKRSLKTRILLSSFSVILLLSVSIAVLGFYIIERDVIARAQERVKNDLRVARSVYQNEVKRIGDAFELVSFGQESDVLMEKIGLHYLQTANREDFNELNSEIAKQVFETGRGVGGTRIIKAEELARLGSDLRQRARIEIEPTPMARPTDKEVLTSAMAKEYAVPIEMKQGNVTRVAYGGRVINRDFEFVDKIRRLVYGDEVYDGKPVGTVTIFQNDVRVSTNVLNEDGERAIGTRVSEEVYEKVVEQGKVWQDRAFVVTHWYKTAYEPIRNIKGDIIGILYVGVLEKPFEDMARNVFFMFLGIVSGVTGLAVLLSFILAGAISRPLTNMLDATRKLSSGDFDYEVNSETGVIELDKLGEAFNEMSDKLQDREKSLKISNEKLAASNKSYIDLISFVSHELKGILASATINAYAVRDGLLGMVNFKQRKALDSVTRNLDYLDATVKKFLNLGRIEKGELPVNKTELNLNEDVFETSVESLKTIASRKGISIENNIPDGVKINADQDLLLVVANNLLSNAVKYGKDDGKVEINCRQLNGRIEIEVYNDSVPISEDQKDKLFHKFSRLETPETRKVKGTGLGLFITKQIVHSHGGRIWLETKENGNSFIFQIERGI